MTSFDTSGVEIQRSLTHRARLRKAYFKMLEREGEAIPEKNEKVTEKDDKEDSESDAEGAEDNENREMKYDDESGGQEVSEEGETPRNDERVKQQTFKDRMRIKKERKNAQREQRAKILEARKQDQKRREELRLKHKKQMTKYTPRGQPVMGSRINRLLDKIRETA
ncbi:hypothetical protein TRICI_006673 [Trichomonascus ciferrii]|uniref:rRNA-processing protein FYV7 n=1 Tax=Trichomonascus ciferrii TaxID=44093 RepID=A0A642UEU1_9ASCO|nr:hypothetical protein TRICI_006673 [Trichomonascus ciferrii]